jgi:hypothetical protein
MSKFWWAVVALVILVAITVAVAAGAHAATTREPVFRVCVTQQGAVRDHPATVNRSLTCPARSDNIQTWTGGPASHPAGANGPLVHYALVQQQVSVRGTGDVFALQPSCANGSAPINFGSWFTGLQPDVVMSRPTAVKVDDAVLGGWDYRFRAQDGVDYDGMIWLACAQVDASTFVGVNGG